MPDIHRDIAGPMHRDPFQAPTLSAAQKRIADLEADLAKERAAFLSFVTGLGIPLPEAVVEMDPGRARAFAEHIRSASQLLKDAG